MDLTAHLALMPLARARALLVILCLALYLPGLLFLPPTDRDESRFAQASKQMVETGDFVNINLQNEPRHKKPIGIYWLQAGVVSALGEGARTAISAYRLPSLVGAIAITLGTHAIGLELFGAATAMLAGMMIASSLVLSGEAMLAKTDAVQGAAIVWALWALARLHRTRDAAPPGPLAAAILWTAIGFGILVKGPVTPAVVALTAAGLCLVDRRVDWLARTRPVAGLALAGLITLPWFVAIGFATHGAFFERAVGGDLLGKFQKGGDLYHGAPPGYHAALLFAVFWPASLWVLGGLTSAWRDRREASVAFCLCWLAPTFLMFELVPTKLPHYTLPALPALAILCARAVAAGDPALDRWFARANYGLGAVVALALLGLGLVAPELYGTGVGLAAAPLTLGALVALGAVALALARRHGAAVMAASAGAVILVATLSGWVAPGLDRLFLSPRILERARILDPEGRRPVVVVGYSEASVPFLLGTGTLLADHGDQGAARLIADPETIVFVERRDQDAFDQALAEAGIAPKTEPGAIRGRNYSNGRDISLSLVTR